MDRIAMVNALTSEKLVSREACETRFYERDIMILHIYRERAAKIHWCGEQIIAIKHLSNSHNEHDKVKPTPIHTFSLLHRKRWMKYLTL